MHLRIALQQHIPQASLVDQLLHLALQMFRVALQVGQFGHHLPVLASIERVIV
ncbi:hypothetical protein D3C76_1475240 [compost metagenome]